MGIEATAGGAAYRVLPASKTCETTRQDLLKQAPLAADLPGFLDAREKNQKPVVVVPLPVLLVPLPGAKWKHIMEAARIVRGVRDRNRSAGVSFACD